MLTLGWNGVGHLCWSLAQFRRCSARSFGELSWPCSRTGLVIRGMITITSSSLLLVFSTTVAFTKPCLLVKDGDLLAVVQHMILAREPRRVRAEDRLGNMEADTADLGRRHQSEAGMDIRRALVKAREHCSAAS